jgi:hypothetical protein
VQGPPRTGLRGTLEQRFELGGRQGDQPVWFLVHGDIRESEENDQPMTMTSGRRRPAGGDGCASCTLCTTSSTSLLMRAPGVALDQHLECGGGDPSRGRGATLKLAIKASASAFVQLAPRPSGPLEAEGYGPKSFPE